MSGRNDPRLLYSVGNINAYHIQNGTESVLSQSGPQTLSLLMVPTSSPFADLSATEPTSAAPEDDFYLHLHLPPELDLSLPATTQIYHQPPRSYLIPRWDLGPESGAFTRIEFPKIGAGPDRVTQEDIDTFETILAQCTAFLERASPPSDKKEYNPANFAPGEGYVGSGVLSGEHGHIVLVDEENGSVVGELGDTFNVVENEDVHAGSKSEFSISCLVHARDPIDLSRTCRNSSTARRRGQPDQGHQCIGRVPQDGEASSLQRFNPGTECCCCLPFDCYGIWMDCKSDDCRGRHFYQEDKAQSSANDL